MRRCYYEWEKTECKIIGRWGWEGSSRQRAMHPCPHLPPSFLPVHHCKHYCTRGQEVAKKTHVMRSEEDAHSAPAACKMPRQAVCKAQERQTGERGLGWHMMEGFRPHRSSEPDGKGMPHEIQFTKKFRKENVWYARHGEGVWTPCPAIPHPPSPSLSSTVNVHQTVKRCHIATTPDQRNITLYGERRSQWEGHA